MVFIYQNWPNDAKLDCKIAKRFVHDIFEVEDVILDDHEQFVIDVSYYENAWWVCGSWHLIFLCNMWQDVVYEIYFIFLVILVWTRWSNVSWGQKEFIGAKNGLENHWKLQTIIIYFFFWQFKVWVVIPSCVFMLIWNLKNPNKKHFYLISDFGFSKWF